MSALRSFGALRVVAVSLLCTPMMPELSGGAASSRQFGTCTTSLPKPV